MNIKLPLSLVIKKQNKKDFKIHFVSQGLTNINMETTDTL